MACRTEQIDALAHDACNTTTCFMPYINAFFQPRKESDRPKVVPDGAVNFAFIGQFAETPRDTIFTTEYSMRTGMESVYTLLNVDRGVPEVWGSKYDVRELLRACYYAIDKKPITDVKLSFMEKELLHSRDEEGQRNRRGAAAERKRPDRVRYPATQKGAARWQHLFALFTNRLFDPPPFFW